MKRRLVLLLAVGMAGCVLASGCGSKTPKPTQLALRLSASPDVNPDASGTPKPLRVRVLQLASTAALSRADFFALDADAEKALGPELLASEDVVLSPGKTATLEQEAKPGTRFLGVVGAYAAIGDARWRAWAPVRANAKNTYAAQFDAAEAALTGGKK